MPLLFSYGTLQQEKVQLSTFGRRLNGQKDELLRFEPSSVKIADPQVRASTGNTHHANVTFNGSEKSRVPGMVFEITDAELASADEFELAFSYVRIAAVLASGREAWLYVHRNAETGESMSSEITLSGRSLQASLTVKDLQKSLAWYTDVAGFTVDRKHEREGKLLAVSMKAGDVRVLINQDDGKKGFDRVKGEGFSLMIVTEQNADEIANRIKAAGGKLDSEPTDMPWGARAFRLHDPDGFKLTISSEPPGARR